NAVNARFRALNIVCLPTVGSTNDEAKRLAVSEGKNALVVAAEQTAGRGRLGRSFYSPDKTGAYFSLALCGERDFAEAVKFTSLAAVAVCRAIENLTDKSPAIKWVNDVYVGEKKVCGILTEAASDMESGKTSFVVTGVGINLTTENFPADVACAGALGEKNLTRSRIISATVCEILKEVPYIAQNRHISYYRERSVLTGKEIKYYLSGKEFYGVAENIDDNGALIVRTSDGTLHTLTGGEVTVRLKG
ncbi:MAG: biotin--[acetyl-CoA-carboxylase] ligase, partial [Clostridia bacterium]|nr:biotin--[acetyl-CoA-carboxylase] ligase [Clostridia bacterium]